MAPRHGQRRLPFLGKLKATDFLEVLSTSEIALGTALLLPVVPTVVAGAGLAAFSPGFSASTSARQACDRRAACVRPSRAPRSPKDVWMLGIAAGFIVDEVLAETA